MNCVGEIMSYTLIHAHVPESQLASFVHALPAFMSDSHGTLNCSLCSCLAICSELYLHVKPRHVAGSNKSLRIRALF